MHTRTAAATLAAALLLTACSTAGPTAAKPKPTPTISKRERYLDAVHAANFQSWTANGPADSELTDYPRQWCDALGSGHTVEWTFSSGGGGLYPIGEAWGTKLADAHELLLLAVKVYCPKIRGQVLEELRASGDY
jgi:ABC-type glycerol-3-phosphate transport system substrate-binding protein